MLVQEVTNLIERIRERVSGALKGGERAQMGTNMVGLFIGLLIAAIVVLNVFIPVINDAIANSTRFMICYLLYEDGDTTYNELNDATDKVGNALNYHLDTLQTAGLITQSKQRVDGQERSIYSLSILGQKLIEPMIELIVEEGNLAEQYT